MWMLRGRGWVFLGRRPRLWRVWWVGVLEGDGLVVGGREGADLHGETEFISCVDGGSAEVDGGES
jgi:hypothetical protein